jgi:hypothetical protein
MDMRPIKFKQGMARLPRDNRGGLNKLEAAYAQHLELLREAGEIVAWWPKPASWRLAATKCFFTPDFMVQLPDGMIEFHETKGYFTPEAKVRTKVAADKYPFTFKVVREIPKKDGGGWLVELVGRSDG